MAREKGKVAEREVAALLEAWWRKLEPDARFVRVPMSGGWQGPDVRKEMRAVGDVMTTSATFPWAVEVKRREAWSWRALIEARRSPVWGWWEQTCRDAALVELEPMLWFRHNREPWNVMMLRVLPVPRRYWTILRTPDGDGVRLYPAAVLLTLDPRGLARP